MCKKTKFALMLLLIAIACVGFYIFKKGEKKKSSRPSFSVSVKNVNNPLTKQEQELLDEITKQNKIFLDSLTQEQAVYFSSLRSKVILAVEKNQKVKINYKKILTPNEMYILKMIRMHKNVVRNKNKKFDKKTFASLVKKLDQEKLMELKLYIG